MLHGGVDVPQKVAVGELRGIIEDRRRRDELAEIHVADGTALAVQAEVLEVAIRNVVAVHVVPRAECGVDRRAERMEAAGEIAPTQLIVAANRELDGRASVAEDVDGSDEPGVDI